MKKEFKLGIFKSILLILFAYIIVPLLIIQGIIYLDLYNDNYELLIGSISMLIPLIFLIIYLNKTTNFNLQNLFEWKRASFGSIIIVFFLVFFGGSIVTVINYVFGMFLPTIEEAVNNQSYIEGNIIVFFICAVIIAPITEEIFFRGILLNGLRKRYSSITSIIISSILFGLMHVNPSTVIAISFLGIIFGYVTVKTNSILPTTLAHALNNLLASINQVNATNQTQLVREISLGAIMFNLIFFGSLFIFTLCLWDKYNNAEND